MGYHDIDFAPVEYFLPNTWAWVGYEKLLPDGKCSLDPTLHCLVWVRKRVVEDVEFEVETLEGNYLTPEPEIVSGPDLENVEV